MPVHSETVRYLQNVAEFGIPSSSWFVRPFWLPSELVTPHEVDEEVDQEKDQADHPIALELIKSFQGFLHRKYNHLNDSMSLMSALDSADAKDSESLNWSANLLKVS